MHADVDRAALDAGQGRVQREAARRRLRRRSATLVDLAHARGDLRLGCAPDTFLGAGLQTCRARDRPRRHRRAARRQRVHARLRARALAPEPRRSSTSAAPARCSTWAPTTSPRSCQLLGPAHADQRGRRGIAHAQRTITSEPLARRADRRRSPDACERRSSSSRRGPIATLVTSFDVQASRYRNIEIYGTEATLSVPDPNTFGGPVTIRRHGDDEWTEIELLARAPPAAPRHRSRRHALGAAQRPRAPRVERARAARARADDRPSIAASDEGRRRRSARPRASGRRRCPVGLPAEHVRRLSRSEAMEPLRYGIVGAGFVSAVPPARARERARRRGRRAHVAHAPAGARRVGARARGLGEARVFETVREMARARRRGRDLQPRTSAGSP